MTWEEFLETTKEQALASGKLEHIAEYLKIDLGDDDTVLINCVKAAVGYIVAAVGRFPDDDPKAELLLCAITEDVYENRELMQMDIQQHKTIEYAYASMILQLQLEYDTWED